MLQESWWIIIITRQKHASMCHIYAKLENALPLDLRCEWNVSKYMQNVQCKYLSLFQLFASCNTVWNICIQRNLLVCVTYCPEKKYELHRKFKIQRYFYKNESWIFFQLIWSYKMSDRKHLFGLMQQMLIVKLGIKHTICRIEEHW